MREELEMVRYLRPLLQRKCFAVDVADFGQTERYIDVVDSIDNEKAVNCIIAYIEKAKRYCESQGISFDDIAVTLNFGLYYAGESSEHTFDEIIKTEPIRDFYSVKIGGAAYANRVTRTLAMGKHSFDPVQSEGYVFVDDETEEFGLGDLCTSFVITMDEFKVALSEAGYELDEKCTNFGGFDAFKDGTSLRAKIQRSKGKRINLSKKMGE